MTPRSLLVGLCLLALIGAFPIWSYSRRWGYYPSGVLAAALIALLILIYMGTL